MNPYKPFDVSLSLWSLGILHSEELPEVATEAICQGIESPTLVQLASMSQEPQPELHGMFEQSLKELGLRKPSVSEAINLVVSAYAHQVCDDNVEPIYAAKAIWNLYSQHPEFQGLYGVFGGLASEWDDMPALREKLSAEIVALCHALISSGE